MTGPRPGDAGDSGQRPVGARHPRPAHLRDGSARPGDAPRSVDRPRFVTVVRGYDRIEVDEHVDAVHRLVERLRGELATAENRLRDAERHAESLENERAARSRVEPAPAPLEEGFGVRAERLLRLAEQEAAEVRGEAAEEAAQMRQQVREDVERQRHEAEQKLIARSAQFDEHAAQRTAELQRRELQIAEQLTAARAEADAVQTAARRAADNYRQRVEADADEIKTRATAEVAQIREQSQQELTRLTSVETGVRSELQRLSTRLTQEIARQVSSLHRDAGGDPATSDDGPREPETVGAAEAHR